MLIVVFAGCGGGSGGGAVSRSDFVAACARLVACRPEFAASQTVTACAANDAATIAALPKSFADAVRCANKAAGDCGAIFACFDDNTSKSGCDPTAVPYCLPDGKQWACVAGVAFVDDCAADGLTCQIGSSAGAACGTGTCAVAAGDAGPVSSDAGPAASASCRADEIVECTNGVEVPRRCGAGEHCLAVGASAMCAGTGAPCPPEQAPRCANDTTLVTCVGGHEATVDCAAGGFHRKCDAPAPMMPVTCIGDDSECDPATFVDRCNGSRLEYCQDGFVHGLDCRELGFDGCAPPAMMLPSHCIAKPVVIIDGGPIDAAAPDAHSVSDAR
jgi:hypothetical protein